MIKMKNFLFKKIEIWIVGLLIIFFIISIIFISGILRDAYLEINKSPKFLRNNLLIISEIPKNIFHSIKHIWGHNIDAPPKLTKHKSKKRFEIFKKKERDALLILPRYDHSLSRSIIDIIDLKNFELIHSYKHDIDQMNDQVKFTEIFPRLTIDDAPIRFEYRHPLLLDDGSIISDSDYTPEFKIDFCSNLKWINDKVIFHHSKMLDHEKNIWVAGQMIPQSNYVNKYQIKNFMDDSIIKINDCNQFVLRSSNLRKYYKGNILAFGDLLHRIHPLAGQGFNMCLRDIKTLSKLIDDKMDIGLDIDSTICSEFQKNIKDKNYIFSVGIDCIYEIFNFESKTNSQMIGKSIELIGKNRTINSLFKKFADNGLRF